MNQCYLELIPYRVNLTASFVCLSKKTLSSPQNIWDMTSQFSCLIISSLKISSHAQSLCGGFVQKKQSSIPMNLPNTEFTREKIVVNKELSYYSLFSFKEIILFLHRPNRTDNRDESPKKSEMYVISLTPIPLTLKLIIHKV